MSRDLVWPSLATIAALLVYLVVSVNVARARGKYQVLPPQTTGDAAFERVLRVQQNTLEQIVLFLPSLWLFSLLISPVAGGALGAVWSVGRIAYARGYYQQAEKRGPGFVIGIFASVTLLLGALVGAVMALMKAA